MDEPGYDADPTGPASLAVLEAQARSPVGRLTVWFSVVTLALGAVAGSWFLLRAFEASRHRTPTGPIDLFSWIIGG